jgi:hypothetical protein
MSHELRAARFQISDFKFQIWFCLDFAFWNLDFFFLGFWILAFGICLLFVFCLLEFIWILVFGFWNLFAICLLPFGICLPFGV